MKAVQIVGALVAFAGSAAAKAVFAHFIVGNVIDTYDLARWESDIQLAKDSLIDGFVLNIAPAWTDSLKTQIDDCFAASNNLGNFTNFFSFDYEGSGVPWNKTDVISILQDYGSNSAHFKVDGKPFVSTFEGTGNASDWPAIRAAIDTGIYFLPDWTSAGPSGFAQYLDEVDGAFSWDMWPNGPADINTTSDVEWVNALGADKAYMMGVSPWFYTDLPGYNKAWVWRGDDMWAERWDQVMTIDPEYVEIVTWNDYGESHYIGPIWDSGIPSGTDENAHPYVDGMSHQHWRDLLPYYINRYKNGVAPAVTEDKLQWWYRLTPGRAGTTEATGNDCLSAINIYGYQDCYNPNDIAQDKIFFSALVKELPATVTVKVGDCGNTTTYDAKTVGVNHWSQPFDGQTGNVTFTLTRNNATVLTGTGYALLASPASGVTNYNAYVGGVPDTYDTL